MSEYPKYRQNEQSPDGQQWFVIAENWQSDLLFFKDEIAFFRGLLDRYFTRITGNLEKSREIIDNLNALDERLNMLEGRVMSHKRHLSEHYSYPFELADSACGDEHAALEMEMSEFVKKFRDLKRSVFMFMDEILKSDKKRHLISNK